MKQLIIPILFAVLLVGAAPLRAEECSDLVISGDQTCEKALEKHRAMIMSRDKNIFDKSLFESCSDLVKMFPRALVGLASGLWKKRQLFTGMFQRVAEQMAGINKKDVKYIGKEYDSDDDFKSFGEDDVAALLTSKKSNFHCKMQNIRYRVRKVHRSKREEYALAPFNEACRAICSDKKFRAGISTKCKLPELPGKGTFYEKLMKKALETPEIREINTEGKFWTPYMAKFVLTEMFLEKERARIADGADGGCALHGKKRKEYSKKITEFWNGMRLKSNYATFQVHDKRGHLFSMHNWGRSRPGYMSVHSGYEFGNDYRKGAVFIKRLAEDKKMKGGALGFDCTGLIAALLSATQGMSFKNGKSNLQRIKAYFEKPRNLSCEAQLEPGDMITIKGHAYLYGGYEWDSSKKKWRMFSYEAKGGSNRAIGKYYRDIPYKKVPTKKKNTFKCVPDVKPYIRYNKMRPDMFSIQGM